MSRASTRIAAAILVAIGAVATSDTAGAEPGRGGSSLDKGPSEVYLVVLDEPPVGAYEGGIAGIPATRPPAAGRLDRNDRNVQRYANHLRGRHDAVARGVGATKIYDYEYSLNGFAATLTPKQVAQLRATPGVAAVEHDALSQPATDSSTEFLGLTANGGLWSQLGGQGAAGEDVIIGVIDTGIWPEHPSFADTGYGPPPAGWTGECQSGELWSQQQCNNKLIGARYFEKGYGHFGGGLAGDYQSARDSDGHGSHTASTAGGNAGVAAEMFGRSYGTISGMAPRARIAAYKACWPGGCATTDLVAAIDAAVGDGVDVINFSIGDGDPDFLDTDDIAFLFARHAGVFVAASAGNAGPGTSTVDHGGPWLTTVGASTQSRSFTGTVTLGSGAVHSGVTVTPGLESAPLVDGAAAGSEGCLTGLDPAVVTGKIVVCKGSFSRARRGLAVQQAGGVGMILYTASETDMLMSDNHYVPALHVRNSIGLSIKQYVAAAGGSATAALSGGAAEMTGGNTMAAFSSRGPLLPSARSTGDLLKPDVTAPGVRILAANTPVASVGAPNQLFQAIGGTSMSSPHVAGVGALLVDLHPDWTPDMIQSSLMTTARQDIKKEDGATPADPFDFGAGHIAPNGAADPGLVYPASLNDYRGFLRSQGLCTFCFGTSPAPVMAPTDLNVPSVTIRALAGTKTVTRTVRNVGAAATYRPTITAPAGVTVTVTPAQLKLGAGASATFTVSFTATSKAAFDRYSFGSVTWSDKAHSVRIPLVVRPVKITAPSTFAGTGTSGSTALPVQFGYQGPFATAAQGLVAATTEARVVVDDPNNNFDAGHADANQGFQMHSFDVAAGTTHARFALFDEFTDGDDDLDVYLYRVGAGNALTLVGFSAGFTSAEQIELALPAAGTYRLYVHGWETDGADAAYTLFSWLVPSTAAGNLTATPSTTSATTGGTATVIVAWSGLTAGIKYLGRVSYRQGSAEIGSTLVAINP